MMNAAIGIRPPPLEDGDEPLDLYEFNVYIRSGTQREGERERGREGERERGRERESLIVN
jgi:hypothetical protein